MSNSVDLYEDSLRRNLADKLTTGPEAERLRWEQKITQYVIAYAENADWQREAPVTPVPQPPVGDVQRVQEMDMGR